MTDPRLFAEYTAYTGEVICQTCCQSKTLDQLEPCSDDPNSSWDVCRDCAAKEKEQYGEEY